MKTKIFICGNYWGGKPTTDGQTVKTKVVTEEIVNRFGSSNCTIFDTFRSVRAMLSIYFVVLPTMFRYRHLVIFPAQKGLLFLSPAFYLANLFFGVKVHYVVIGGWLPLFVDKHAYLKVLLKRFDCIYAETQSMVDKLKEEGLSNVVVMPNFKKLEQLEQPQEEIGESEIIKLCTFSRVMKEKGIEDAVNAVVQANLALGGIKFNLSIFGNVQSGQENWFELLKKDFPEYVAYEGVVNSEQTVATLQKYHVLLFPTYYNGEGFAGTLIDAFAAGLPVVASDWKYNAEIVKEGETGWLFRTRHVEELQKILIAISKNRSEIVRMSANCLRESKKYLPNNAGKILFENLSS